MSPNSPYENLLANPLANIKYCLTSLSSYMNKKYDQICHGHDNFFIIFWSLNSHSNHLRLYAYGTAFRSLISAVNHNQYLYIIQLQFTTQINIMLIKLLL